ncbi:MAG: GumC family protein [Candidatus Binatia bacterium]
MDWIEIDGKQVPLLEPPQTYKEVPRRTLQVLFKYKRLIRNVFLAVSLPLLLIVLLAPQKYRGTARVFIKPSRAFLGPDNSLTVAASNEALNTEIQLIRSREVLGKLGKELPFPDAGFFASGSPYAIEAAPVKATSIIQISLTSTNPAWTANVVNRAAELYQEQSLNVRRTRGIEKFYDEQDRRLRAELLKAEQDLKDFQQREGIVDAPKEVDASLTALAIVEKSLKDTESGIRETEKRIAILEQQLKTQQTTVSSSKSITVDPAYAAIRSRLTQLELEKQSLLQRYLPKDRLVLDKEREITELTKQLQEAERTTVGSENITLNAVHQRILNELLAAKVQLQALREKSVSEANQVASYSTAAADKKKKSYEYDRLQQIVNTKKEALSLYQKRAEEARISDAMDEQKFSNVVILDRARLPLPPAGYSTFLWVLLIAFFSTAVSVGVAFVVNYFDPTVQDEAYVEDEFGLPVLATIEHYDTQKPGYFIATN